MPIWLLAFLLLIPAAASAQSHNVLLIICRRSGTRPRRLRQHRCAHAESSIELAARGTLFTNAFATVSSCSPSRSVIYTGLYSHSNGMYGLAHDVHNQHLLPWVRTLPQLLKAARLQDGAGRQEAHPA